MGDRRKTRRTAAVSREPGVARQCQNVSISDAITMAYKYGVIVPWKSLFVWNGIGRSYMRDRIGRRARQQIDLADRKPLAKLQQLRRGQHVLPGLALAEEIDVEIGRHRKADRTDRRQQHHIHREIGHR